MLGNCWASFFLKVIGGAGICGCGELFHPGGFLTSWGGFSLLS